MIGASARYLILVAWPNPDAGFPHTTFVENIVGAFLLGLFLMLLLHRLTWRVDLRPLVATGALGSFTTFSALTEEVVVLVDEGRAAVAVAYAVASVALGLLAAGAGIVLGRGLGTRGQRA
jgi:fluoride exporter